MDQAKQNREAHRKDKLFQIGSGRDGFETANRFAVKPALHFEKTKHDELRSRVGLHRRDGPCRPTEAAADSLSG